jgi:hypothetical protein
MKRIAFLLFAFLVMNIAKAQTANASKDVNKLFEFTNADYNMGKIPYGKPLKYDVTIKNVGIDTATLENVQAGCGCTTPEFEKGKKFGPGETIKITLGFNGNNMGMFSKVATIYFNGGLSKIVTFKGEAFTETAAPAATNTSTEKVKTSNNN